MAKIQYGNVIYESKKVASFMYAELHTIDNKVIYRWHNKPINGKTSFIKQCAKEISNIPLPFEDHLEEIMDIITQYNKDMGYNSCTLN